MKHTRYVSTMREKAHDSLLRREGINRNLFQAMPIFFVAINGDGTTMMMNDVLLKAIGYSEDEVIGKDYVTTFVPADEQAELFSVFTQLMKNQVATVNENRVLTKDGKELLVEWYGRPVYDENGRFEFFIGVGNDITERRNAEKDLLIEKAYFEQLFESSPEAIVIVDNESRVLRVNSEFTAMFGYTAADVEGLIIDDVFAPGELREEAGSLTREAARGTPVLRETLRQRKDGTLIDVSILGAPIYIDGVQVGVYGIYRDITERKEAEDALRKSEEKYRTILNAIEDGYYEVDLKGNFTFFNRALIEILGYTEKELMGMNYRQYTRKEDAEMVLRVYNGVYRSGIPAKQINWELIRKGDGSKRQVETSVSLILDYEDRPIGFRGIFRDVTERKQAEELYEALANTSRAGVYIVQDGKFQFINYNAARYAGYREDEMVGMDSLSIVHPEDRNHAITNAIKMVQGETTHPYEFRIITKNGRIRWIMETLTSIEYRARRAILGNSLDITELREARQKIEESEERLLQIVDGSSVPTFVINSDHTVTHWNKACENLSGIPAKEMVATRRHWAAFYASQRPVMADLVLADMPDNDIARYYGSQSRKSSVISGAFEVEKFFADVGDNGKWLFITSRPLRDHHGRTTGAIETLQDVTDRKQAEELYATLANSSQNGVYVTQDDIVKFVNPHVAQYSGYAVSDLIDSNILGLVVPEDRRSVRRNADKMLKGKLKVPYEYRIITKDGHVKWLMESVTSIIYEGRPAVFANTVDISDRKKTEKALRESERRYQELSITDGLTLLYNRRHFYHQLRREIDRSIRYNRPLSLLLLDVDDFKYYNDTYGHLEGDEVLARLAQVIRENIRTCDSAYRYGGEEFVIILPESDGTSGVIVAERIREAFKKEPFTPVGEATVHVTFSVGVSEFGAGEELEKFLTRVDEQMYRAKKQGKDCVVFSGTSRTVP